MIQAKAQKKIKFYSRVLWLQRFFYLLSMEMLAVHLYKADTSMLAIVSWGGLAALYLCLAHQSKGMVRVWEKAL